jgi:hypothetical protein
MKLIKFLTLGVFALGLMAGPAFAESCCEKAKAEGKQCTHKCCVAAAKDGKVCEKCNGKSDEGKHKGEEKK